jgi:hypothetical protein
MYMRRFIKYRALLFFTAVIIFTIQCDLLRPENNDFVKQVPDNTIFIVSTLEATADTVHHYPEVYVGSVTHKKDFFKGKPWVEVIEGIWWPILNAQVNKTTRSTDLVRTDINDARVRITGPLDSPKERTVGFAAEGLGVYGDQNYELKLNPGGTYRLDVTLDDGRRYHSTTTLPQLPVWSVPETLDVELKLESNGRTHFEQNVSEGQIRLPFEPAPDAWMTTGQINYKGNDESLQAGQQPQFQYRDRGKYLRSGGNYLIRTLSSFPDRLFYGPVWSESSDKPLKNEQTTYMRLSQLNEDLSKQWLYQNIFIFIGASDEGYWAKKDDAFVSAHFGNERTSTYLFENSNILKVGANGETLPKARTDAIGVFGGFSTVYRTMVMKPVRSWDPDTLDWGPK